MTKSTKSLNYNYSAVQCLLQNLALYEDSDLENDEVEQDSDSGESADCGPVDENNLKLPGFNKPTLIQELGVVNSDNCSK